MLNQRYRYKPRPGHAYSTGHVQIKGSVAMVLYRLTNAQLRGLKEHKYSANGTSVCEVLLQPYWRWLVTKVPLWVAPNLLTATAFLLTIITTLPILILDSNLEGVAPKWSYLLCAVGFFMHQTLDSIDGKQARRTNSANQLGELFDHGCDAISFFLVLTSGVSAIGVQDFHIPLLTFVMLLGQESFFYHWQAYVCGVMHFKYIDVTEAQFLHIALLLINGVFGAEIWQYEFPFLGVTCKAVLLTGVLGVSFFNLLHALSIILSSGVGKNGTTVANTSVISPIISTLILSPAPFLYVTLSSYPFHHHCLIFLSALCLPNVKTVINMMLATMTKTPYPLLDPLMVAPWGAFLNVYMGTPLPEAGVLVAATLWSLIDILVTFVLVCRQVASYLQVPIFSLPKH